MGIMATVEERMESEAEFGLFFADLKIAQDPSFLEHLNKVWSSVLSLICCSVK